MEPRRRRRPLAAAWLWLGVALGCVLLPSSRGAADQLATAAGAPALRLAYLGYLDSARVVRLDVDVDLANGEVGSRYRVAATAVTIGLIGRLFPFHLSAAARGSVAGVGLRPMRFDADLHLLQSHRGVTLAYRPNGSVVITADPPTVEASHAASAGLAERTVDPVTATMALIDHVVRQGECGGRLPIFDGTRRYDLVVSPVGESEVAPLAFSFYSGPARQCAVAVELLDGFNENDVRRGFYPLANDLWLANVIEGVPPLPVRAIGRSSLGVMRLDLIDAKPIAAGK